MSVSVNESRRRRTDPLANVLTGVQAVPHLLVRKRELDALDGLRTASFVSGYPGSPLAGLDQTLLRFPGRQDSDIFVLPAVNEELAATAVWGSQVPLPGRRMTKDGVVGVWFGKAPGLERAGDAIRHANTTGVHPRGGVLALVGDDPAAKSSTLPSASERTMAALSIPVFVPASSADVISLGLYAFAASRLTGLWAGMKIVADVADGVGTVDEDTFRPEIIVPAIEWEDEPWSYEQRAPALMPVSLQAEQDLVGARWHALESFIDANPLNPITGASDGAWIGVVAAGHTHRELIQALADMGLPAETLDSSGVRLWQPLVVSPLSADAARRFARGLQTIIVVEEKTAFLEVQLRNVLYGISKAPEIVGERDGNGRPLVPADGQLTSTRLMEPLRRVLGEHLELPERRRRISLPMLDVQRTPYFCSGCPHNRSTAVPEGSLAGLGIGCHAMAALVPESRDAMTGVTQMGGEGAQWLGQAPFNETEHIFQNLGDGTFAHSGQLAVQACVAAGVNITFKVLYNDAIAMTGAQAVQGGLSVPALTRKLHAEGVVRTIVCAEEPRRYPRRAGFAPNATVWSRDRLDEAQRILREVHGVTVLIYDQMCAAEARRLRKKGTLERRTQRVLINEAVCEGCGDCGEKSNCLSVEPVDTEFGRKTRIDQSSCNTDYTCLDGDCPSFVTVDMPDGIIPAPTRAVRAAPVTPEPSLPVIDGTYNIYLVGVGGTGIVTVNRVLAVAADLDGLQTRGLDQLGGSQKAGAVSSHLRLGRDSAPTGAVPDGAADTFIAFDLLAGTTPSALERGDSSRTRAFASTASTPTGPMVRDPNIVPPARDELLNRLRQAVGSVTAIDAARIADQLFGSSEQANVLLLGAAYQAGALPITGASIEEALTLNGVAVERNLTAFAWGRAIAHDPTVSISGSESRQADTEVVGERFLTGSRMTGEARRLVAVRAGSLVDYQNAAIARRYVQTLESIWTAERDVTTRTDFTEAVARGLHRVMAYKDEYEVARLLLDSTFRDTLHEQLPGARRLRYRLHPPSLRSLGWRKKIGFSQRWRPVFRLLAHGRILRGTIADPFGRTSMRQLERELATQYSSMVLALADELTPAGYDRAVEAATAVDMVRGFEDVKVRGWKRYKDALSNLGIEYR